MSRSIKHVYRGLIIVIYKRVPIKKDTLVYGFQITQRLAKNTKTLYGSKGNESTNYMYSTLLLAFAKADEVLESLEKRRNKRNFATPVYGQVNRAEDLQCKECGRLSEYIRRGLCEECSEYPNLN